MLCLLNISSGFHPTNRSQQKKYIYLFISYLTIRNQKKNFKWIALYVVIVNYTFFLCKICFFYDDNMIRSYTSESIFFFFRLRTKILSFVLSKKEKNKPTTRKKKRTRIKNKVVLVRWKTSFANSITTLLLFYLDISIYVTYSRQINIKENYN